MTSGVTLGESGATPSFKPEVDYIPKGSRQVPWRICTNFAGADDLMDRFGQWPDYALMPERLESLYRKERRTEVPKFSVVHDGVVKPAFPFLEETEGLAIQRVFESSKESIYPEFRHALKGIESQSPIYADRCLLLIQTLLVLYLRHKEKETGIWEERSPEQRLGTIFAAGNHIPVSFTRVNAFVAGIGRRLAFPWGGAYKEYGKLLSLMEDPYTAWVLRTADDDLHVLAAGPTVRGLKLAGLIEFPVSMVSHKNHIALNVPAIDSREVEGFLPLLTRGLGAVASETAPVLYGVLDVWKRGQYDYLEGCGDYLEMAYAILAGLLFKWAMEDGLLGVPPKLTKFGDDYWVVQRTFFERLSFRKTEFPGLSVLRQADSVWERLLERS